MQKLALLTLVTLTLPGCSYLFPEDWREGEEPIAECTARLNGAMPLLNFRNIEDKSANLVPTYTFDITKMDFAATQELIEPGADETLGSRLMKQTNEVSTARAQFLNTRVDEKGAFFFGQQPALWRVRGETLPYGDILKAGCERQLSGMRLIRLDVSSSREKLDDETEASDTLDNDKTGETTR